MKTFTLFLIVFLLAFSAVSEAVTVFETDYDASHYYDQFMSTRFVVTEPGKFVVTLTNPDASRDAYFSIIGYTGEAPRTDPTNRTWMDRLYPGYAEPIYSPTTMGVRERVFEFSVMPSEDPLSFEVGSNPAWGQDNSGINHVKLEFIPDPISTADADYFFTITSGPTQQNSAQIDFDSGSYNGKIILHNTLIGTGGGGYAAYLDGHGLGVADHGRYGSIIWTPEYVTYEVGPGTHHLVVAHEDCNWPDNGGTREVMVYYQQGSFVPEPGTIALIVPTILGLAGIALRKMRRD